MKRVIVDGMRFLDEDGAEVLFNGLCFICRDKKLGYIEPEIESKLRIFAQRGFNLVRLGIFWGGVEPEPGIYDERYLDRIEQVVRCAEAEGIYVFLDMHQDLFSSKFIDGAPIWATLDDGLPHPDNMDIWYEAYLKSPAVIRAADNFWANKVASDGIGLLDHYENVWTHLADRFSPLDNIIGFEPMNEPFMGSLAPQAFASAVEAIQKNNPDFNFARIQSATPEEAAVMQRILTEHFIAFDREVLMPFYNRMLRAIRRSSSTALVTGGNIYCSSFVKCGLQRVTDFNGEPDSQQIYAPHGYAAVVDSERYDSYSKDEVTAIFNDKRQSQIDLQLPVVVGEWGNFPSAGYTRDLIEHMNRILEKNLWSSTYHQYAFGMEDDPNYSSLERGYPAATAGRLVAYHYDRDAQRLSVEWEARGGGGSRFYHPNIDLAAANLELSGNGNITIEKSAFGPGGYVTVRSIENQPMAIAIG